MLGSIRNKFLDEYPEDAPESYRDYIIGLLDDLEMEVIRIKDMMQINDISELGVFDDVKTELENLASALY